MEITINGKAYKVKYGIRAMMAFEKISEKNFEIKSLTDLYIYYYCMLLAGLNEEPLTFDEFIDACDNEPTLLNQMSELMNKNSKVKESLSGKKNTKKKQAPR